MQLELEFYNTIHQKGTELEKCIHTAQKQGEAILKIMKIINRPLTPYQVKHVYERYRKHSILITSVRRSLTNLTNTGHLEKTDKRVLGEYGSPNHLWKVKP